LPGDVSTGLTTELTQVVQLAVRLADLDELFVRALDWIDGAIPHELAAMPELRGDCPRRSDRARPPRE
jgi:hypothetical protein